MGNFEFSTEGGGGRRVTKERVIGLYKLQFFVESFRVDVLRAIYAGTKREICSFSCFSTEGGTYKCWEGFLELMRRNVGWIYVTLGGGCQNHSSVTRPISDNVPLKR